jgi:hypothetical protein
MKFLCLIYLITTTYSKIEKRTSAPDIDIIIILKKLKIDAFEPYEDYKVLYDILNEDLQIAKAIVNEYQDFDNSITNGIEKLEMKNVEAAFQKLTKLNEDYTFHFETLRITIATILKEVQDPDSDAYEGLKNEYDAAIESLTGFNQEYQEVLNKIKPLGKDGQMQIRGTFGDFFDFYKHEFKLILKNNFEIAKDVFGIEESTLLIKSPMDLKAVSTKQNTIQFTFKHGDRMILNVQITIQEWDELVRYKHRIYRCIEKPKLPSKQRTQSSIYAIFKKSNPISTIKDTKISQSNKQLDREIQGGTMRQKYDDTLST